MMNAGLSLSAVGAMWAARSVLAVVGPGLWGILADKRGDARPFAAAALLSGAALLAALSFVTRAPAAVVVFGLYGLLCGPSGSMLDGLTLTALTGGEPAGRGERAPASREGKPSAARHFGRWRLWGTVGFGVTSFSSTMLVDRGTFVPLPSIVFPACAVLTGAAGVAVLFVPRLARPALGRARDVLPVLLGKDMRGLFLTTTILWCSHIGYVSFLLPLAAARGLPTWSVAGSLAAAIVVEVAALRMSGLVIGRFGGKRVLVATTALAFVRFSLTAITTSPVAFVALNGLHGITFGLFFAALVGLVAQRSPAHMRQAAQGTVVSSSFGVGGALGALLCGALLQHAGAAATWGALAALALVAVGAAWRAVRA